MIKKSSRPKGRELLEGVDDLLYRERLCIVNNNGNANQFQPTLPVRGATAAGEDPRAASHISTHAPRAGSDCCG